MDKQALLLIAAEWLLKVTVYLVNYFIGAIIYLL